MRYIGTISSDARGKLGGIVATRARNGTNFKAHAVPTNAATYSQQTQRQAIASAVAQWKALTAANRISWQALAAQYTFTNSLAQNYSPTGLQLFTQAAVNSLYCATTLPATAPLTPPVIVPCTLIELTNTGSALAASFFTGGTPFSGYLSYSLSSVISPTINYTKGIRRRQFFSNGGSDSADATPYWNEYYGAIPPAGSQISCHVVTADYASSISATPFVQTTIVLS